MALQLLTPRATQKWCAFNGMWLVELARRGDTRRSHFQSSVFWENFYNANGTGFSLASGTGHLTNVGNPADGTPGIFRGTTGADPGLNVWTWSTDVTVTFTAGLPAFSGTGTWNVAPAIYSEMLAGNRSGNLYFPADDVGDLGNATLLGGYAVVVPEPSSWALISLLGIVLLGCRKR